MESVDDIEAEAKEFLNDAAGAHVFSRWGVRVLREQIERQLAESIDPNAPLVLGMADAELGAIPYQRWPLSSIPARLRTEGPIGQQIGHQWVVAVWQQWEDSYRPRLAAAVGCRREEIAFPVMGDLRHLRNDIVHHRGIASAENSGRCTLLARWFELDHVLMIHPPKVAEFMRLFHDTLTSWKLTRDASGAPGRKT